MSADIERHVRSFIETNFLFRTERDVLSETESLLEAGLIDSTGILELVGYLETHFGLSVDDADIVPENLDSIQAIAAYVRRKLSSAASQRDVQSRTGNAGRAVP